MTKKGKATTAPPRGGAELKGLEDAISALAGRKSKPTDSRNFIALSHLFRAKSDLLAKDCDPE